MFRVDWFRIKKRPKLPWTKYVIKIIVLFEPIMAFWCPFRFRLKYAIPNHSILWRNTKQLILCPLLTITTFVTCTQSNTHTDRHNDSMTYPAQRAMSVKIKSCTEEEKNLAYLILDGFPQHWKSLLSKGPHCLCSNVFIYLHLIHKLFFFCWHRQS